MKIPFIILVFTISSYLMAEAPFQIGLVNPVQYQDESESIKGVKLNIVHSANSSVTGLDLGFASEVRSDFTGVQFNFLNLNDGNTKGAQIGWGIFGFSSAENMTGLQWNTINNTSGQMTGLQLGLLNMIHGGGKNFQFGLINYNKNSSIFFILPFINFNL